MSSQTDTQRTSGDALAFASTHHGHGHAHGHDHDHDHKDHHGRQRHGGTFLHFDVFGDNEAEAYWCVHHHELCVC